MKRQETKATKDESESQKASKESPAGRSEQEPRYHIREETQLKHVHCFWPSAGWLWHQQLQRGGDKVRGRWGTKGKPGCERPRIWQAQGMVLRHEGGKGPGAQGAWGGEHEHEAELLKLLICKRGQKAYMLKSSPAEIINHSLIAAAIFFSPVSLSGPNIREEKANGWNDISMQSGG